MKNEIRLNILNFLFHTNPNETKSIMISPNIFQARDILHELDHYLYHKDEGIIGSTKEETMIFQKEHMKIMELRSYRKTHEFLIECKKYFPKNIKIDELFKDKKGIIKLGYNEFDFNIIIEQMINNQRENIELIKMNGVSGYKSDANINSIEKSKIICRFLNIKIKISDTKNGYYYIKIKY